LAADWIGKGGRARKLRDAEVSAARQKVGAVVCVKAAGMKEAWHLAASDGQLSAPQIIKLYSKRWIIEPSFRDSKDLRFGMGMSALRIDDPQISAQSTSLAERPRLGQSPHQCLIALGRPFAISLFALADLGGIDSVFSVSFLHPIWRHFFALQLQQEALLCT
jgi:hypothetical protein